MLRGEGRRRMGQTARFQETLRKLAMIDEGFVEDEAGLGLGQVATCAKRQSVSGAGLPGLTIFFIPSGRWNSPSHQVD